MPSWAAEPWASSPWASLGAEPAANPLLARPAVVWAFELYFRSSFPVSFPWEFESPPLRVTWVDCYPGLDLGDVLYEGRLLDRPQVSFSVPDQYGGGLQAVDGVRVRLWATSTDSVEPDLHTWVAGEHRGKLVLGHLVQLNERFEAVEVAQNVFRGEIVAMADDPSTVDILCRALDVSTLADTVPRTRVSTATYPYADPEHGLGLVTNLGIGIGRRLPCRHVKIPSEVDTATSLTFTATVATDIVQTSADHFLETGSGPLHVSSTDTLPGGLAPATDYWAIATATEDELQLATTRGNALAGMPVDITSTGSGTHTLTGGLPPNLDTSTDVEVGHGNLGIVRMWLDETADGASVDAVPEAPVTYTVLPRTYKPDGRWVTAVRFHEAVDGIPVSADVLRVYPDVDDAVVSEWKWLRGFEDEIGGRHAASGAGASPAMTTSDLVSSHQGYGLGMVLFSEDGNNPPDRYLEIPEPAAFSLQDFTVEAEFWPLPGANGDRVILRSPGGTSFFAGNGWSVLYNHSLENFFVFVTFVGFGTWQASTANGSAPTGRPYRIALRRSAALGRTDLVVGTTVALTRTDASPDLVSYAPGPGLRLGGLDEGATTLVGRLGYVRVSNIARTDEELRRAYWLWRRNGIEWCREVAMAAGVLVDQAAFDTAATAWDAIENGSVRTDGWLVEDNQLRDVLAAMVPMRDLRFDLTPQGRLAVTVPEAPVEVLATFGHGEGEEFGNLLALPTRTRASVTEAVRELVVRFRRARNGGDFARDVRRPVHTVGQREQPLEMPFLDDIVAADIVCDWRAKRLRTRDQALDLALNHEGRFLGVGDVIRLQVPAMGITDVDAELVQLAKGAERSDARVVPVSAADHVYTPRPLPADPAERLLGLADLGNDPTLTATLSGGRVLLTLTPQNVSILRPVGPGTHNGFQTIVGASAAWQAVDDVSPDDETSYIESAAATFPRTSVTVGPFTPTGGTIVSVTLRGRVRLSGGNNGHLNIFNILRGIELQFAGTAIISPAGTYTDHSFVRTTPGFFFPGFGSTWSAAILDGMEIGYAVGAISGATQYRVTQLFVEVREQRGLPNVGGFVRYWVVGPSASQPATPEETDPVLLTAVDFAPQVVDQAGTSGQTFWFWARAFDELGRLLTLVGPASVTLP